MSSARDSLLEVIQVALNGLISVEAPPQDATGERRPIAVAVIRALPGGRIQAVQIEIRPDEHGIAVRCGDAASLFAWPHH